MMNAFPNRHPAPPSARAPDQMTTVRVSPSRPHIRRADPSVSFQVVAGTARFFDIIVATDTALFDPQHAHRRTHKNFRSSRQDFQGQPIEIETGFYMLPRAFIRDMVSVTPRPTRMYYVAVAYADQSGQNGLFSVPPEQMSEVTPYVTLADDLHSGNLGKVLGVAVERLGVVNASGRVMSAMTTAPTHQLPEAIGGLPLIPMRPAAPQPNIRPAAAPPPVVTPEPAPDIAVADSAPTLIETPPSPIEQHPLPSGLESTAPTKDTPFVDNDYAYGASSALPNSSFRDLDALTKAPSDMYDDGYGEVTQPTNDITITTPNVPAQGVIPPLDPAPNEVSIPAGPLPTPSEDTQDALIQLTLLESGGGRYDALNLDGAFRGRFGETHPYFQRAHEGLSVGPHQVSQDSGELGQLLSLMYQADTATFRLIFGAAAQEMLSVVNTAGPSGLELPEGRAARVQRVEGKDLWEEPWVDRFRKAALHAPFQRTMRAHIASSRFIQLEPMAAALGLNEPRGKAMVLSLAISLGAQQAIATLQSAVNPFDTPAKLSAALEALGHTDINGFRHAQSLPPGDQIDTPTHFALITALRTLGSSSPVQIPDAEAIMDMLVTTVGPGAAGDALLKLRVSEAFANTDRMERRP